MTEYSIYNIRDYIKEKNVDALRFLKEKHNLVVKDGKIMTDNHDVKELAVFWDQRQMAMKINLNALYGGLLNKGSRFHDKRIGQSVTLTGRSITRHMISKTNEIITGNYDYKGGAIIYSDTDSVAGDSWIETNIGNMTIEDLFNRCSEYNESNGKEYGFSKTIQVKGYDPETGTIQMVNFNYVYRHKVSKRKFRIYSHIGDFVEVTEDHSVMVVSDNGLTEVKPSELLDGEILIDSDGFEVTCILVKELEPFDNEYVYDIGVNDGHPYFFANGILVHNSVYYSAIEAFKNEPENPILKEVAPIFEDKSALVEYYDWIGDEVNDSFPEFMNRTFNTGYERGGIIKAGRELVGSKALFIKKKRYAIMVYDDEGTRVDVNGKPGKLKIMGLDIKRSDTPAFVQEFLQDILVDTLQGESEKSIINKIAEFRSYFRGLDPWLQGSPKKVNGLTGFYRKTEDTEIDFNSVKKKGDKTTVNLPGHVKASMNWNTLRKINNDQHSSEITDGYKVIVCRLKKNPMGYDSIAYPADDTKIPDWFKDLPFDSDTMELNLIDKKVENLLGILNWDLDASKIDPSLNDLFSF